MPNTYVALRTETVAVATGTVTFDLTSISGYTDLVLVAYMKPVSGGNNNALLRFNNDSGSNYSATYLAGDGSTASSTRGTSNTGLFVSYGNANGSNEPIFRFNIQNYSNSTTFKTTLNRNDAAGGWTSAIVGLWRNTAAITRLDIVTTNTNIAVGSTFSLYGIANADQGSAKATGGIITEDSTYWYHTFGASGAFIPKQSLTCDVLVVAGGGGGGSNGGAGGGAGGLRYFASESVTATSYNVTIGAGGGIATSGVNTTFGALTAATGGGAGGSLTGNGSAGGSGGGGGSGYNFGGGAVAPGTGGAASPSGQGNAGAGGYALTTSTGSQVRGGGGGGASAAGTAATASVAGVGGTGSLTYSSWGIATGTGQNVSGTVYYAGGGGGGAGSSYSSSVGGSGGGGTGGAGSTASFTGTANTGGGGGGGGNPTTDGAAGGSGVVIVRYLKA